MENHERGTMKKLYKVCEKDSKWYIEYIETDEYTSDALCLTNQVRHFLPESYISSEEAYKALNDILIGGC